MSIKEKLVFKVMMGWAFYSMLAVASVYAVENKMAPEPVKQIVGVGGIVLVVGGVKILKQNKVF